MKISKMDILLGAAEMLASAGAGAVIGNVVKSTTPYDLNKFQKVIVGVGSYTVGAVLSDLSAKYVRAQITGYSDKLKGIMSPPSEDMNYPEADDQN